MLRHLYIGALLKITGGNMTTETKAITGDILKAFSRWISQPDRCDPRDYGDSRDAWWQEKRGIAKQKTRARKALNQARKYPLDAEAMQRALNGAFSGRLQWNGQAFEYCTGQYFPTEFALAAAVVLEAYVNDVRPKFTPTEEQRGQWWDIVAIERANYNAGGHWFDASAKRFFRSRVLSEVYQGPAGVFFVSSEKGPSGVRAFTVREFDPRTADVKTFGPFNEMSRSRAQRIARIAAECRKAAEEILAQ